MNERKPENNERVTNRRPTERVNSRTTDSVRRSSGSNARRSDTSGKVQKTAQRQSVSAANQRGTSTPHQVRPSRTSAQAAPRSQNKATAQRRSQKPSNASSYNNPSLWTKDAPRQAREVSGFGGVLSTIGRLLLSLLGAIAHIFLWIFHSLGSLMKRSRAAFVVVLVVLIVGVGTLVDTGINWGKAYSGVHIGDLDVSGKSVEDIQQIIQQTYADRLAQGSVTIYANEQVASQAADALAQAQDESTAEQQSVEEAQENKQIWTSDAQQLSATLPAEELAREALTIGREQGGLFTRIGSFFGGWIIPVRATYDSSKLEKLAADIDATLGDPRVDFNIAVTDGVAQVTDGHDGTMIDRHKFAKELDSALLSPENMQGSFVAKIEYAPLRIDHEKAQTVADEVNSAIASGARFTYEGSFWEASATDLGAWITTNIEEHEGSWKLVPEIDEELAKPSILAHVKQSQGGQAIQVSFIREGDQALVQTNDTHIIPKVTETVYLLEAALFGENGSNLTDNSKAENASGEQGVEVAVVSGEAPAVSSFEEALSLGLISEISSYTTEFTNKAGTENRNHNIRLVSDLLHNSIVKPDETWSFNGTTGECNEEKGFLGAGAIINGEYDDAIGGGICQVATTVFNSVFDSGFPVVNRRNHSLYMSSYPAGRDAAVSWEELDFVWKNDSSSDVLLRTSYTDTSVTIMLFGINPGYRVTSSVGEWLEGEKYKTKVEVDENMAPGTKYVKTAGADGKSITVIRTVTSPDGEVMHEDVFHSNYNPLNEVVVAAPGVEVKPSNADTE